ncbi:hypothetical protein OESDEN_04630 [Oesophagostomum dentatum]|uniref:Uncharacterized protein n=1 Tax=Oesophagostomum dentatum TaxID=61180 RepID=A0A0B1TDS5_OESDE|nr:hypothetical protein OESDEN_04630 [Oesophagostomum dentatum]
MIVAAVVLVSVAVFGARLIFWREKRISALPELPYNLNVKSSNHLACICTDILTKNPIVWCIEDFNLLWNRNAATGNAHNSSKWSELIKNGMIPVIRNRPLQFRLEEILEYDLVVTIGTAKHVSDAVPGLPDNVGDLYSSQGGMVYKLIQLTQLSSLSATFKYEVKNRKKSIVKNIELLLFYW